MIHIKYNPNDRRYIFMYGDPGELKKLEAHLNKTPSYMFMPSFRGIPKPEVFLNKMKTQSGDIIYYCFAGLWKEVVDWCDKENIQRDDMSNDFKYTGFDMSLEEFTEYVQSWHLNIEPRPYQIKSAWLILKYRFSLSQLATRAGKTLMAYIVFRYMLEHGAHNILMVVPNITLVKQGVNDMNEYQKFFNTETIWADGQTVIGANLTIGTFQSLVKRCDKKSNKYDPKFFDKFDVVLIDECHTAQCESIKNILRQDFMKHVKLRFGFSGSLPDKNSIESFACQSLLGPCVQDIRSKELMDQGFITPVEINQIRIHYEDNDDLVKQYIRCGEYLNGNDVKEGKKVVLLPKEKREFTITNVKTLPFAIEQLKRLYEPREYMSYLVDLCKAKGANLLMLEQMLVHRSKKRLDIMDELLFGIDKNTIVFAHHTEYLRFLESHFKSVFPDRPVYIITGSTSPKSREKIIQSLLTDKGAILCASYGCVGTGLTLKNIDYGIFAQSFKSSIINKQAIGRGLCLANDKDKYRLFDLVDCFPTGKLSEQGMSKARLYKKERFEFHVKDV